MKIRHASVIFVASVNEEFGFSGAKAFTHESTPGRGGFFNGNYGVSEGGFGGGGY